MIGKIKLGFMGENLAATYLEKSGYIIKERNFRTRTGEIDIVATKDDQLVFIEVKTRSSLNCGEPIEAIDMKKLRRLYKLGEEYKAQERHYYSKSRVDVVEVLISHQKDI